MADDYKSGANLSVPAIKEDDPIDMSKLNKESFALINQIIAEANVDKAKDLTYLFNLNQNKKTIVRVNKLNALLDTITDEAMRRFSEKPDEITNQELIASMKTVNDMIERGQKQVIGATEMPLIQINQQNNEVNVGSHKEGALNRDSREKVKNAVMNILNGLVAAQPQNLGDVPLSDSRYSFDADPEDPVVSEESDIAEVSETETAEMEQTE